MEYQLAKELKNVRFPQMLEIKQNRSFFFVKDGVQKIVHCSSQHYTSGYDNNLTLIPTLSELIEACGEEFCKLIRYREGMNEEELKLLGKIFGDSKEFEGKWLIIGYSSTAYGKTPEEAVARLYIALNKK